jgi:hypothetical protein
MKVKIKNAFVLACGAAAAILIAGTMSLFISRPAAATPQFAQQTGVPCAQCLCVPKIRFYNIGGEVHRELGMT